MMWKWINYKDEMMINLAQVTAVSVKAVGNKKIMLEMLLGGNTNMILPMTTMGSVSALELVGLEVPDGTWGDRADAMAQVLEDFILSSADGILNVTYEERSLIV